MTTDPSTIGTDQITNPSGFLPQPLNPIVDEIDRAHAGLSPQAKQAISHAHDILGLQAPPEESAGVTQQAPAHQSMTQSGESPFPSVPSTEQDIPIRSKPMAMPQSLNSGDSPFPPVAQQQQPKSAAQTELARLTAPPMQGQAAHTSADTGQTGISQIHSPWARIPLQIADAVGSGLFPKIAMGIPGTAAHHQLLVNQAAGAVGQEEQQQQAADKSRLEQAQATEQESLPELHKTQAELATSKLANAHDVATAKQTTADAKQALAEAEADRKRGENETKIASDLAAHGYKLDPETKGLVPLPYEEMSEQQQAIHDLKASQSELADSRAALTKAQKENIPVSMDLARKRIDNAQRNHDTAMERLGLSEKQFEMRAHGTEGGQTLPGAILGDDNKPVGTAFQQNVRPTGTERNKADLASSAHEQLQDIKSIVANRPDIFGPVAGRTTDFTVWLGSQDPDAQRFRAARTIAGDHLAGVFGGRSEAALNALDSAIGHFKDNPAALQAGLDQLDKANNTFLKKGTPKTAGSEAAANATAGPAKPKSKAEYDALPKGAPFIDPEDGKTYHKK